MNETKFIYICILLSLIFACCITIFFAFHKNETYIQCKIRTEKDVIVTLYPGVGRKYNPSNRTRAIVFADSLWQTVKFKVKSPIFRKFRIDFEARNNSIFLDKCSLAYDEFALDTDRIDVLSAVPLTHFESVLYNDKEVIKLYAADSTSQVQLTLNLVTFFFKKIHIDYFIYAVLCYPLCFIAVSLFFRVFRKTKYAMSKAHWGFLIPVLIFWVLALCAYQTATVRHHSVTAHTAEKLQGIPPSAGGTPVSLRRADGLEIAARLYGGEGAARANILLLHGNYPLGQHLPLYPLVARALADRGFRVLTIDFAGFGLSQTPFASDDRVLRFDLESETEAALAYLKTLSSDHEKLCVIGHSLGANPALWVGLRDPAVQSIVLIGPPRRVHDRFHSHHDIKDFWARALQTNVRRYGRENPPSWYTAEKMQSYFLEHDIARLLAALRGGGHKPIYFLDGDAESEEDLAYLRSYVERVSAPCEYVTLRGVDHTLNVGSTRYDPVALRDAVDILESWCDRSAPPSSHARAAFENFLRRVFPFK